jgi:hypothetical protein
MSAPPDPGDLARSLIATVLHAEAKNLAAGGIEFARLGGGVCLTHALAGENTKDRSVIVLICGPVPDDLIQSLGQYVQGLAQDMKLSGVIREIRAD